MSNIEIDNIFKKGIRLKDRRKFKEALDCFVELLKNQNAVTDFYKINFMVGSIYYKMKLYNKAIRYYNTALDLEPTMEISSLGKYLCFCQLELYDKALMEIIRFLKFNRADLYLTTLEELNLDLKSGNINDPTIALKLRELIISNNISKK